MKRLIPALLSGTVSLLSGCAFLDAASEVTIGDGKVPRVKLKTKLPPADELVPGALKDGSLPGLPDSYAGATLAHLDGILRMQGTCSVVQIEPGNSKPVVRSSVTLARCDGTDPCDGLCPDGFDGLVLELGATVRMLDANDVKGIRKQLSKLNEDSIVQIRMRFFDLGLSQVEGDTVTSVNDSLSTYRLRLESLTSEPVDLVTEEYLGAITPDTPQRFELPPDAALTRELKQNVLAAEPFELTLVNHFEIPRSALYGIVIAETQLALDIQPEFVISVLQAVEGK